MPVLAATIRLLLAVLFARAAVHKLHSRQSFTAQLMAYKLLPAALAPAAAIALASTEIVAALLLLQPSSAAGLLLAAVLLLLYATAMAINLVRGNTHIDCGCSGPLLLHKQAATKTISWSLVLRNIALASLAVYATTLPATGISSIGLLLLVLAGTASSLLLLETSEQALANSQRYRHWLAHQPVKS